MKRNNDSVLFNRNGAIACRDTKRARYKLVCITISTDLDVLIDRIVSESLFENVYFENAVFNEVVQQQCEWDFESGVN